MKPYTKAECRSPDPGPRILNPILNPKPCTGVSSAGIEHKEPGVAPAVADNLWGGPTEVHRAQRIPRSTYVRQLEDEEVTPMADAVVSTSGVPEPSPVEVAAQSLQEPGAVRFWTDYLKVGCCDTSLGRSNGAA